MKRASSILLLTVSYDDADMIFILLELLYVLTIIIRPLLFICCISIPIQNFSSNLLDSFSNNLIVELDSPTRISITINCSF